MRSPPITGARETASSYLDDNDFEVGIVSEVVSKVPCVPGSPLWFSGSGHRVHRPRTVPRKA